MRHAILIPAIAALLCTPPVLRAQDTFIDSLASLKTSAVAVPEAAPAKAAGAMESYDPAMGQRLAEAAEKGKLGVFKGKCYEYVAWHMDAAGILGFYDWVDMGIQPDYSDHAADFSVWAAKNEEKMRGKMKLAILPTPASKDEVPLGSILVYDRGWCGFSSRSGHIEVLTAPDRACSDGCESLDQGCFADPSVREHVHVYIPVKE